MREIKHLIEILFANFSDVYKFCQIYQINFFQEIVEKRIKNNTENDLLNRENLLRLQYSMKNINFYIYVFKNCDERVKEILNSRNKIHLKQNNFSRMTKKIHNKFIFEKIVAIIIISTNLKSDQSIKRDILIQNIENDDLIYIFY